MKIKICGLFNPADIDFVNEALPDYIGFVFARSRRRVTPCTAAEFKKRLDKRIKTVGVFVNAEIGEIAELYADGIIGAAQLHASENDDYIKKLKRRCEIPVIKAVNAETNPCLFESADFIMLDNGAGGTGQAFNWSLIPKIKAKINKPFFLAGGININNIHEAVKYNPYCVDLSGGAEDDNGNKDKEKILSLVRAVRDGAD